MVFDRSNQELGERLALAVARLGNQTMHVSAKHVDVDDSIFLVGSGRRSEPEVQVKLFEPPLRGDLDCLPGRESFEASQRLSHQRFAQPGTANRWCGDDASDRALGVAQTRLEYPGIGDETLASLSTRPAKEMPGYGIP